jgi:GT2 family glycosyltransferase/CDP-glycerol glycerophosphotransferase (TagB/SpsB family)/glycosyltransferase involved in cell wall biosynthesis
MKFTYRPPLEPETSLNEHLILFYSFPDYSGNSLALYEYVRTQTSYEAIWAIKDETLVDVLKEKGIPCFWLLDRTEGNRWFSIAKYVVTTHEFDNAYPKRKGQIYGALGHSLILSLDQFANVNWKKDALKYGKWKSTVTDLHFVTSGLTRLLDSGSFFYDARKAIVTGEPRCDLLFHENGRTNLIKLFPEWDEPYQKIMLYVPTAKRSFGFQIKSAFQDNIFNFDSFDKEHFGAYLEKEKACLLVRFHPSDEEHHAVKIDELPPHCYRLDSKRIALQDVSLYNLLNGIDLMIGDFSSLTQEYLLLDRPIVRVTNDLKEQVAAIDPGFGNPDFWFPGDKVTTQDELEIALASALQNPKKHEEERMLVRKLLFDYVDGNASVRVLQAMEQFQPVDNLEYEMYTDEIHAHLTGVQGELDETKTQTIEAQAELIEAKTQIIKTQAELIETKTQAAKTQAELAGAKTQAVKTQAELTEAKTQLAELAQMLRNKEGHIELLLESERELERIKPKAENDAEELNGIKASRAWRAALLIGRTSNVFVPPGSFRRIFAKTACRFVRHPLRFLRKMSPRKIARYFQVLRTEGAGSASRRLDQNLISTDIPKTIWETADVELAEKGVEDYPKLVFSKKENPVVSIIVPVYNQFPYTYNCLSALLKNTEETAYEIIIADDCSTDLTTRLDEIVQNITIIKSPQNLRFLKNCNNAAAHAKGEYIFFLNNDTQVQKNWLAPLVRLMEQDAKTGLAGSKLVYADGRLQEAGGIIWDDASAWNYGNGADPDSPEYNYVKEADYISGAAILIRKNLWETIGGFDERYAPAYYEDSDLAFEVRRHGYKVMYQPASVVVHFEGISNGTTFNDGQKAHQLINQQVFFDKWKDVLGQDQFPSGQNVFAARDRSRRKKTLLMVDHYVPHYDQDAGSRTIFQYLLLFKEQGFNVKFMGDNFYKHEPYATELEQKGIEVLYGPYYQQNWKIWLQENNKFINYVFLNRPHVSSKYIDIVKKFLHVKVFYYVVDLHYLRERREYELMGDKNCLAASEDWKKKELSLMVKADVVYTLSHVELAEIKSLDSSINCKLMPINIFPVVPYAHYSNERKDLLFVGGFSHKPNLDAVVWMANEICPILHRKRPEIKIHIIGSNAPDNVKMLAPDTFIFEGFVTDEQLKNLYQSCRIAVVPLRYGAGVKGKVVEAMYNQIPVITTSVGAEGLTNIQDVLIIKDTAAEFAEEILQTYDAMPVLSQKSKTGLAYVMENFTTKKTLEILAEDFDFRSSAEQ